MIKERVKRFLIDAAVNFLNNSNTFLFKLVHSFHILGSQCDDIFSRNSTFFSKLLYLKRWISLLNIEEAEGSLHKLASGKL
jgi:hypothetical protein